MKTKLLRSLFLLALAYIAIQATAFAQATMPFKEEIEKFEQADKANSPKKGAVLFIGSSSIRLWKSLPEKFGDYAIINRGFGGSTLADVNLYSNKILFPYRPSKIFVYAGENDLAGGRAVDKTFEDFLTLYQQVNAQLPHSEVYYISVKPSPSRQQHYAKFTEFNSKVKAYIEEHNCKWSFIDVATPMLGENGLPPEDLFVSDRLHMSGKGYAIWEKIIKDYL